MALEFHGTTILCVRKNNKVVMIGDGQVSLGPTVMKSNARKVRKTYNDNVICGFAGSTADAFTLFDKFSARLEEYHGNLLRAAVEMAKDWRTNKVLRNLEAMLCVADNKLSLIISGNGDVIEPEEGIMAIGSGGLYAQCAARALYHHTELTADEIALEAMKIAASVCIYTNENFSIEELIIPKAITEKQ